jgi:hypothetical protein
MKYFEHQLWVWLLEPTTPPYQDVFQLSYRPRLPKMSSTIRLMY